MATVIGGPNNGERIEVKAPRLIATAWPPVRLSGVYEDGSPRLGSRDWVWRLAGDHYELVAEPVREAIYFPISGDTKARV